MSGTLFVAIVVSFAVGGIPFGYLIARGVLKDDIRRYGSGNIGATNVGRVCGWRWGGLVLVLDALKGLLPTLSFRMLSPDLTSGHSIQLLTIAAGISAIAGHMFPVWLGFRGGKGVATALGVVVVVSWKASLTALAAFLIVVRLTRMVALASIIAALVFMGTQLYLLRENLLSAEYLPVTLFSTIVPLLIIWRHRSNIQRMLRGEENRIGQRTSVSSASGDSTPNNF
ncbi:MAG: glycerol-3-phosphate 1-O-acyltransferase PlsY [Planctomycetota bacterium]